MQVNLEFDALIGAQGTAYRFRVWARSRCCIVRNGVDVRSVGVAAGVLATVAIAFPMLMLATERNLVQLLSL